MKTVEELAKENRLNIPFDNNFIHRANIIAEFDRSYINGYNKAKEWISVEDELPDKGREFIGRYPSRPCDEFDWYYLVGDVNSFTTHWKYID